MAWLPKLRSILDEVDGNATACASKVARSFGDRVPVRTTSLPDRSENRPREIEVWLLKGFNTVSAPVAAQGR